MGADSKVLNRQTGPLQARPGTARIFQCQQHLIWPTLVQNHQINSTVTVEEGGNPLLR